ncbi:MAG: hypothetical protein C6I01_02715 [Epsilonproteobacteria bacterium]|jgi:zinc transport system permease protein|nr:hypothetical protein [Campylobacterota bacterium]NPA88854.1 metal ABC transporter permease [Campylobacterota bacterium]
MGDFLLILMLAGFFVSVIVGIVGSLIVFTRSSSLTGAVSHANFGAVGLAFYFHLSPQLIPFAIALFSGVVGLLLSFITFKLPNRKETLINGVWAVGMSLGILFLYLGNIQNSEVLSYLFGNFLFTTKSQLYLLGGITLFLLLLLPFTKIILSISYDPEFMKLRHIPVGLIYTLFLVVVSVVIGLLVQSVGIILLLALFTLPPIIVEQLIKHPFLVILFSSLLTFGVIASSILLSLYYPLPLIPLIVLILAGLLIVVILLKELRSFVFARG